MNVSEIEGLIATAKDLDFVILFSQSVDLFKKLWLQGLVTLILNMVLAIPVFMIFYIPLMIMGVADVYMDTLNGYSSSAESNLSPITIVAIGVLYLFMIVAMSTIGFALKAAFYRICKIRDLEEPRNEDYFYFFKKPYLGKTIKLSLAFVGISLLAALLCLVPLIYAVVPLSFMYVTYALNPDLSISEIINLSFKLGNKKWLITFGLLIVSGLLAGIVGFLMCGVGIYVTSAFSYLPTYLIYKEAIGFNQDSDIPQLEDGKVFN